VVIASRAFLSKASGRKQRNASPCHRRHAGDQKQMRGGFDFLAFHNNKTNTSQNPHFFEKKKSTFLHGAKIENHHTTAAKFVGNTQGSLVVACVHCLSAQLGGRRKQTDRFV